MPTTENTAIRPFHVNIPDEALVDLRRRIKATKWPEPETVKDPSQGVQLATMQKLADYWANHYDWRKIEASEVSAARPGSPREKLVRHEDWLKVLGH